MRIVFPLAICAAMGPLATSSTVQSAPRGEDSGCGGATTSVTAPVTPLGLCADATDDGQVTASDALVALHAAVGGEACLPCLCDVNGDGQVSASDALAILLAAVGTSNGPLDGCPQPCPNPADPCVGATSCDRQTVDDEQVVTGSTATGYHTVIDGSAGSAQIEWTVAGASTSFRYSPPGGVFGPSITIDAVPADVVGVSRAAMLLHRSRVTSSPAFAYTGPNTLSNTSGCDQLHAFDCGPIGKCCDVHDDCINEHCGGQGDCGNVIGALEASYGPSPCSPDCLQCHGAVVKCFFDGSHPGASDCCEEGDCGRPQECMINGRVITDPCHCRDQGITSVTPCPDTCLTDCTPNFAGCLPDATVATNPSCCCSCQIRIGSGVPVCACQDVCCPDFPECEPAGADVFHFSACCSCAVTGPGPGGKCE